MSLLVKINYKLLRVKSRLGFYNIEQTNEIGWGIVGTGDMSQRFSLAIQVVKGNRLRAICSRDYVSAGKFSLSRGGKLGCYTSVEDMVKNEDIDIIYIATPVETHFVLIKECIRAGVNVLCEKPLVTSQDEVTNLLEYAAERGVQVFESLWSVYLPKSMRLRNVIRTKELGEVKAVKIDFYKDIESNKGLFEDYGVYVLGMLQRFFGDSLTVVEKVSLYSNSGKMTDISAIMRSDNVKIIINMSSRFKGSSALKVFFSHGEYEFASPFNRGSVSVVRDFNKGTFAEIKDDYRVEGYEYIIENISKYLKGHMTDEDLYTLEDTQNVSRLISLLSNESHSK